MPTLLLRNIHTLMTLNADRQPIGDGAIYVTRQHDRLRGPTG